MKIDQQNRFVRFILRAIDVFVRFYGGRQVRWDEEPFQKASESEKRSGGSFMAFFPAAGLALFAWNKQLDKAMDYMMYHSIIWLYVFVFLLFGGVGGFLVIIAPKIRLSVSVPIAILMWAILGWCAWKGLV